MLMVLLVGVDIGVNDMSTQAQTLDSDMAMQTDRHESAELSAIFNYSRDCQTGVDRNLQTS